MLDIASSKASAANPHPAPSAGAAQCSAEEAPCPFFSIITATYNAAATLPRLATSLAEQTCRDFQWVVQDGASDDNMVQIVDAWQGRIPSISYQSAKDTGIYNAWNKAIARMDGTLGQWVLFLGADDRLMDAGVLERAKKKLEALPASVLLGVGDFALVWDESQHHVYTIHIPSSFSQRYNARTPLPHSALFARKVTLQQQPFDATFRIAGDYDWMLTIWKEEHQAIALQFVVTEMGVDGISNNAQYSHILCKEQRKILKKYFPLTLASLPRFCFLYVGSFKHQCKMYCKKILLRTTWGQHFWQQCRIWRKKLAGNVVKTLLSG